MTLTDSTISGNSTDGKGGGVYGRSVTLLDSTISGNTADGRGAGMWTRYGTLSVTDSTISGNVSQSDGGGIYSNYTTINVVGSTVSGNSSVGSGGGVWIDNGGLTIESSTFTANSAGGDGGGVWSSNLGDSFSGSLFAGNTAVGVGNEIRVNAGTVSLDAYNLIGDDSQTTAEALDGLTSAASDILATSDGSSPAPLESILDTTLADNGGPTFTHALAAGSPAINAGDPAFDDTLTPTDQRGLPRVLFGRVDVGAYEFSSTAVPGMNLVVSTTEDVFDGDYTAGNLSLREAVEIANVAPGDNTVTFTPPLSGQSILLDGTELEITETLTIDASALAENVTIDAQQNSRVLNFSAATGDLTLGGLNIQNGSTTGDLEDGGGIRFDSDGTLTLTGSTVSGNTTTGSYADGGGIFTSSGAVTLTGSTVSGNTSGDDGGGIFTSSGAVTLTDSTVSGNTTTGTFADGGGIFTNSGAVTLTGSTVSGNESGDRGGGIFIYSTGNLTLTGSTVSGNTSVGGGGGIRADSGVTTITTSTVSGNTSGGSGGGLRNGSGSLTIVGSTFTGNSANSNGGAITSSAPGATISGSLFAGNTALGTGNEIRDGNGSMNLDAYNLIGDSTQTTADALDGVSAGATDLLATSNELNIALTSILDTTLADNGGPTQTHALLTGSPAIDMGDPDAMAGVDDIPLYDQRGVGFDRVSNGRIDIGAFELQTAVTPDCDFDDDGDCDIDDIDTLIGEIAAGTNDVAFDLTGDSLVDLADRDQWLVDAGARNLPSGNPYLLGDANLDGVVDTSDFNIWNQNKFTSVAAWSAGDFNADGVVDTSDFNIWNTNKFTSSDATLQLALPSYWHPARTEFSMADRTDALRHHRGDDGVQVVDRVWANWELDETIRFSRK